ncbi:MAG: cation transporter [bacterium]|nr:cation transporter [bacterium]
MVVGAPALEDRPALLRRGRRLEFLTIGWNFIEAIVSVGAGLLAGSVSLIGFGIDSVIESLSGAVLLWRLGHDDDRHEGHARRLVAVTFFLLAAYVGIGSARALITNRPPDASVLGIVIAALSLIVMPVLARAKRAVALRISSSALVSDSRQTDLCAVLSAILLVGLALNALLGWWWADPVAGLSMVPIIAWEGCRAWRGEECGDCHPVELRS